MCRSKTTTESLVPSRALKVCSIACWLRLQDGMGCHDQGNGIWCAGVFAAWENVVRATSPAEGMAFPNTSQRCTTHIHVVQ